MLPRHFPSQGLHGIVTPRPLRVALDSEQNSNSPLPLTARVTLKLSFPKCTPKNELSAPSPPSPSPH